MNAVDMIKYQDKLKNKYNLNKTIIRRINNSATHTCIYFFLLNMKYIHFNNIKEGY